MIDPNTYILARVIHEQRIEEALQRRRRFFQNIETSHQSKHTIITDQMLSWLGIQFVQWGLKLQGHPKVALPQPPNC